MRRSGSQLRSLSNHAGRRGYGHPAQGQNAGTLQYADEIQRRIDALGINEQHTGQHTSMGTMHPAGIASFQNPSALHPPAMPYSNYPHAQIHQPMYADFPSPGFTNHGAEYAVSDEMSSIRESIDVLGGQLHAMQQAQVVRNSPHSNPANIGQFGQPDNVAKEVAELKRILADIASDQSAAQEIANLRASLEATKAELAQNNVAPSVDSEAYARVVETSHNDLTRQIEEMRQALNKQSNASIDTDIIHKTLEASHDELKAQIEHLHNSINESLTAGSPNNERLEESHNEVIAQLSDIQALILENAENAKAGESHGEGVENIEIRLEEITRAVVALSHSDPMNDGIDRIEARIGELSKKIGGAVAGAPAADDGTAPFVDRLDSITERLDELAKTISHGGQNDNSVAIMYELSQKVDALNEKLQASNNLEGISSFLQQPDFIENLQQLSTVSETLGAASNMQAHSQAIEKLESNVDYIVSLLDSGSFKNSDIASDSDFAKKLNSIEEQLASNRDISIEMATQVAQDTVERVMDQIQAVSGNNSGSIPELSVLTGLSEDIHRLQEASSNTNSQNLEAFNAIKDTLGSMVDRLSSLEHGVTPATEHARATQTQDHAPEISEPKNTDEVAADDSESNIVPKIPSIEEFDDPVRLTSNNQAEKATGQDMVAEYRALVTEKEGAENKTKNAPVSVAQSLVDEAARAEEERRKLRASMSPSSSLNEGQADVDSVDNDREFHSSEMAIETFEDDMPTLPSVDVPEIATPTPVVSEEMENISVDLEDRPLEPGSAGPDLAALVRKANETRKNRNKSGEGTSGTDFIAAARRAAQAAAQEASAAHDEIVKQEGVKEKGMLNALPSLFSKRKKVISLAAIATLFAAMSVPLIVGFVGGGDEEFAQSAKQDKPQVETVEEVVSSEDLPKTPRLVETKPADILDEEIVVASLGDLKDNNTQQPVAPAVDTSQLTVGLDYVNDPLKQSVLEGNAQAIYEVGRRHFEGLGVEKSQEKAFEWYLKAAELNFAPAQYLIANFNEKGIGTERNIAEAMKWYERAANNGNVISMHNLAVLHATPNGTNSQPDTAAAFKWFKKAASFGVKDSLVNLGIFYTKGVGTDVDLVEAYKWFTLAAKAGDDDAGKKREVITEYMRPDQLQTAKTQVEDWRPAEQVAEANTYAPQAEWVSDIATAPILDNPDLIRKTQTLLGRLGYDAGPADGIMGDKTKQAIAQFQQRVGLDISGEISAEFLAELEAVAI